MPDDIPADPRQTIADLQREVAQLRGERDEALEQQAATAEVLGIINASPGDLAPVFEAMLDKAMHLCRTSHGEFLTYDGERFHTWSLRGYSAAYTELRKKTSASGRPGSISARIIETKRPVRVLDLMADEVYGAGLETRRAAVDIGGARSVLAVPLLKDDRVLGAIVLSYQAVRPFTDKQIALLENFAAQAVIAMENARLLGELRERTEALVQRNREHEERIEQQSATIDVLKVMSASPDDPQPVFDLIAERARTFCDVEFCSVQLLDNDMLRLQAAAGTDDVQMPAFTASFPRPVGRGSTSGRAILTRAPVQVADTEADPEYGPKELSSWLRSTLSVPMVRAGVAIGAIGAGGSRPGGYSASQIELLETFAEQAVIAITSAETYRALQARTSDLQESLEYQTATSEVLTVISRSTFDLQPVLDTVVETAARLCAADLAHVVLRDGDLYRSFACFGMSPEFEAFVRGLTFKPGRETTVGQVLLEAGVVQQEDIAADPDYAFPGAVAAMGNVRSHLGVPLGLVDDPVGVFVLARTQPGRFTDRQVELVKTFADQAVIAIENTRLITETRTARDAAQVALRDLKAAQANLVQAEKMASLGQLTAGIAHEIKNPLNFVNNFAGLSVELLDELKESAAPALGTLDDAKRAEFDETFELLTGNLDKIAEHGRRADNIVKSMLEHSRGATSERRKVDLNSLVEEAANLAYHGARARDQGFNLTLERDYDRAIAEVELVPQEMNRVLINLIGNGFYAAVKRQRDGADADFRPTLTVATRELGEAVEIRIRDNGVGIAPGIRDKLFQPFFTTKPTGEGTGLGLSISYDIVTQQHGGTIEVNSRLGEFTEFTIHLPRGGLVAATGATA